MHVILGWNWQQIFCCQVIVICRRYLWKVTKDVNPMQRIHTYTVCIRVLTYSRLAVCTVCKYVMYVHKFMDGYLQFCESNCFPFFVCADMYRNAWCRESEGARSGVLLAMFSKYTPEKQLCD